MSLTSAVFAYLHHGVLSTSGLHARYWTSAAWDGAARVEVQRDAVALAAIRQRVADGPVSVEWRGFLIVPQTGPYRIGADADDALEIELDRRTALRITEPGSALATVDLTRGLHAITIRYRDVGGTRKLSLYWAQGAGPFSTIPAAFLVPDVVAPSDARLRRALVAVAPIVPLSGSLVLLASAFAGGAWILRQSLFGEARGGRVTLVIACITAGVFAMGIWWGLPDYEGWAPDELSPDSVVTAVEQRLAGGWTSIYPPLHYVILALFSAPFHLLAAGRVLAIDDIRVVSAMFLVHRAVSLLMALGIVAIAAAIGARTSARASVFASAACTAILPLTYYAKTANVDVPYVFWLLLSMAYYLRAREVGGTRNFLLFVVFGCAAIATKDQAYGFYVVPAIGMAAAALRHRHAANPPAGTPSLRVLGSMIAAAVLALLVGYNALLNPAGFVEHVRIITGSGSEPYRIYARSLAGHARMAADAVWQLASVMSWPLLVFSLVAAAAAWRMRVMHIRALVVVIVSYYLTVIAVIGYHYDRFFLAPAVILAIAAGWGADAWTRHPVLRHPLRAALLALIIAYAMLRVAALDAIMVRDSRYAAEAWLLEHVPPGATIAASGKYLPRRTRLFWTPLAGDGNELTKLHPDFIVVNVGYSLRRVPGSQRGDLYAALAGGRTAYRKVFEHRTRLFWSPLDLESRFSRVPEDPQSNLSKINPLIEIYAR